MCRRLTGSGLEPVPLEIWHDMEFENDTHGIGSRIMFWVYVFGIMTVIGGWKMALSRIAWS